MESVEMTHEEMVDLLAKVTAVTSASTCADSIQKILYTQEVAGLVASHAPAFGVEQLKEKLRRAAEKRAREDQKSGLDAFYDKAGLQPARPVRAVIHVTVEVPVDLSERKRHWGNLSAGDMNNAAINVVKKFIDRGRSKVEEGIMFGAILDEVTVVEGSGKVVDG